MSKEEFDRLMETSPTIPENIIHLFKNNFVHHDGFNDIVKPEICDILIPTNNYRNPWFHEENRERETNQNIQIQLSKITKLKRTNERNNKIIKDFIESFVNLNNREPMESEIIDNLKDKIDINIIKKVLQKSRLFTIKNDNKSDENV